MDFEWDDAKRGDTLAKRKLDFADAFLFFDGRPVMHQPTARAGEHLWKSTASFDEKFFTLVWTWRAAAIRIISMRRSHA